MVAERLVCQAVDRRDALHNVKEIQGGCGESIAKDECHTPALGCGDNRKVAICVHDAQFPLCLRAISSSAGPAFTPPSDDIERR